MSLREELIKDIEVYVSKQVEYQFGSFNIDRATYENLAKRIAELKVEDFESKDKYRYFLEYYNQIQRIADRTFLENVFVKDELEQGPYLWMTNYLRGIADWIK